MDQGEKNYCNILDLIADEGRKELVFAISKLCMTSLYTSKSRGKDNVMKKKTVLLIPEKDAKKCIAMADDKAKECLKRHIFNGVHTIERLKEFSTKNSRLHNMLGEGYEVSVKGDNVSIGGVKVTGEKTTGNNGIILMMSGCLDPKKAESSGERKVNSKKKGSKKVEVEVDAELDVDPMNMEMSGGYLMNSFNHPILNGEIQYVQGVDNLLALNGIDLRWNILENYRYKWPTVYFNSQDLYNYKAWCYASLIAYLQQQIPDFYLIYTPYKDPVIGLEQLLQYRMLDTNQYLITDDILYGWIKSPLWMMSNPQILNSMNAYIMGGGGTQSSGDNIIGGNPQLVQAFIAPIMNSVLSVLNRPNVTEGDKRLYIIDVYKKVETDDKFRSEKGKALYRKQHSEIWPVTLGTHLYGFTLWNAMNRGFMNKPFSGGKLSGCQLEGGADNTETFTGGYAPTLFDEVSCAFGTNGYKGVIQDILQPHKERGYRFGLDFLDQFVRSPFFLYAGPWYSNASYSGAQINNLVNNTSLGQIIQRRGNFNQVDYPFDNDNKKPVASAPIKDMRTEVNSAIETLI